MASTMNLRIVACCSILVGCSQMDVARFSALTLGVDSQRVARRGFALQLPAAWQLREGDAIAVQSERLAAFEAPPANGRMRIYRLVDAELLPPVAENDAGAVLARQHEDDELVIASSGTRAIAGRGASWQLGRMRGPAADVDFDVLDVLVPGTPQALLLTFRAPAGQMNVSRDGFFAIAESLRIDETIVGIPAARGSLASVKLDAAIWFDERFSLRLPTGFTEGAAAAGLLAVYVHGSGARCEVSTTRASAPDALERSSRDYLREHGGEWRDLEILAVERSRRSGREWLRVRATCRDATGTMVIDDSYALVGARLDRVLFRSPQAAYVVDRGAIDAAVASLVWR
jgi:hypothetical protein